jgi:replication protein
MTASVDVSADASVDASAEERRLEGRALRYWARRELSAITGLPRLKQCGQKSIIKGGAVLVRASETDAGRRAGFGGLSTCGSIWSCPVCSAKITARRAVELERAVRWNADRGGSVALATFTVQHHAGHRLRTLRRALMGAWRHIVKSRAWREAREMFGLDHYVRAVECTIGFQFGWHLHVHCLLFFEGVVSESVAEWLTGRLYKLWSKALAKDGFEASRKHGVDVRVGQGALDGLGKYLSKIVFEAVGGRFKQGRRGGRTPFELLHDGLSTGNADDLELWFEWEQDSKGMQQLVWSNGLKTAAGVDDIKDGQIAAEDAGGETVLVLSGGTWPRVYVEAESLLEALEKGGITAACGWLDARDLPYQRVLGNVRPVTRRADAAAGRIRAAAKKLAAAAQTSRRPAAQTRLF